MVAAATLLTRLPVARWVGTRPWPDEASCVWAFPVVGALVGGAGGAVVELARRGGLPPGLAAILAVAAMLLLTGALHEDGLADTADGFGGGATAARKLEIMRDSRIGSYGALALIVAVALRATSLAALPPGAAFAALVAAGGLGRGAMVVVLGLLKPARRDGTAASLQRVRPGVRIAGLGFAVIAALLLPFAVALLCVAGAAGTGAGVAVLARRQVGGYTGDVLGASGVVAECAVLCLCATALT